MIMKEFQCLHIQTHWLQIWGDDQKTAAAADTSELADPDLRTSAGKTLLQESVELKNNK